MIDKCNLYIDFINENILPKINYEKLQNSCKTEEKAYAKGVLNLLYKAMVKIYDGDIILPDSNNDDNFAVVPGVVRGKNTGDICIALLGLDLDSSGEHCSTDFLCEHGVISQNDCSNQSDEVKATIKNYLPYDYCYAAIIPNDIHVDMGKVPSDIKEVLSTFRNHATRIDY